MPAAQAADPVPATVATGPDLLASRRAALAAAGQALRAQIDAHEELQRDCLLAELRALTPSEFERLTGNVLAASGLDGVVVTPPSRDGGIDGHGSVLIGIVRLRLAFQCKLYTGRVDRTEIDTFRGAIQGRFDQGVFVTTSEFTEGARQASHQPGAVRVELIDGNELVRRIFDHDIGVERETFRIIKSVALPR
jgi:restriction system protein